MKATLGMFGLLILLSALLIAGMWWAFTRPAKPQPQPTPTPMTSTRTPAQNLAVLSGRSADDSATATALARLDALCPESEAQVADLVVNLQGVLAKAGHVYSIPLLMDTLSQAQEGSGQTCLDTATALSLTLER
ncbi:hypothetical protein ASF71_11795 [Deinococcus sp. Leaf326]|nr:hypothetical protein ASF71_11795 [Deinococcus sp. Leaf326]